MSRSSDDARFRARSLVGLSLSSARASARSRAYDRHTVDAPIPGVAVVTDRDGGGAVGATDFLGSSAHAEANRIATVSTGLTFMVTSFCGGGAVSERLQRATTATRRRALVASSRWPPMHQPCFFCLSLSGRAASTTRATYLVSSLPFHVIPYVASIRRFHRSPAWDVAHVQRRPRGNHRLCGRSSRVDGELVR